MASLDGGSEQPPPVFHRPDLLWPPACPLIDAQHTTAGRGLPMVQHRIRHGLGDASFAQRGGEGPAKVVPRPTGQAGLVAPALAFRSENDVPPRFPTAAPETPAAVCLPAALCRSRSTAESQRMQVQPVRIAVLRHVPGLAPLGGGEVDMRPVEPRRLATPARHRDQEPGEVTPYRLASPPSGFPEAGKLGRRQVVRPRLRRPWDGAHGLSERRG